MQNNSDDLISQDDNDSDKQFSETVKEYQRRVIDIIAWLFTQEEELQKRPPLEVLQNAKFTDVLDEYSRHDDFMTKFSEHCHVVMKANEDGQQLRDDDEILTDEDRDEVGIQLDAMMVCYEKLKILIYDRLHNLRAILEDRQQTQVEQFEEWLSRVEKQLANITSIGPDYDSVKKQLDEIDNLSAILAKQQEILNFISNVVSVIFDDVNPISLQIRSRSSSRLDIKLEHINCRWQEVCRLVEDRKNRLIQAQSIWKILNVEGMLFSDGLKTIEKSLQEMFELANNITHTQSDKIFVEKLKARSLKVNDEIFRQQSFYTMLEEKIKGEIEKINNPNDELCSLLIHELSSSLDYMQIDWDKMMKSKRTLEYKLQLLDNPAPERMNYLSMIPVPDPITSRSNTDLTFSNIANSSNNRNQLETQKSRLTKRDPTFESLDESQTSDRHFDDSKLLDISNSSDSRSLLYNNMSNSQQHDANIYANNSTLNDSRDELSTNSMSANSYPINNGALVVDEENNSNQFTIKPNNQSNLVSEILSNRMHLNEQQTYLRIDSTRQPIHDYVINDHNCKVEEWKASLESFSNWLRQVETSLDITNSHDGTRTSQTTFSRLDPYQQLIRLHDFENQIKRSCQDEFDCLLLQGNEIIEDLVPEIGENEYESYANKLRVILSSLESRYAAVKGCLHDKKQEIFNEGRWTRLLDKLQVACTYLIKQLDELIPETFNAVDLITLAQQQDQLMHVRGELEEDEMIQSSIQNADVFLKICDFLQTQITSPSQHNQSADINSSFIDDNTWMSFRTLKDNIEKQRDSLLIHCSELSHSIEERLQRLDEVHKEMHALQHKMQELAPKLQVAEILRSNWVTVDNLTIEELSEQLEDLKLFRERVNEIESIHRSMNSIFDWMEELDVRLSQQNLNRIKELNETWVLIQSSIEERQKAIEQAFDNQSSSEQRFLNQTLADLPNWERRVATSKVPYFIDHDTNKTHWDHPKFDDLLKAMSGVKQYIFSAYRTALKLRMLQKKLGIDMLMLEQLKQIFEPGSIGQSINKQNIPDQQVQISNSNDTLIGVEQIIAYLRAIYEKIQKEENSSLDASLSIDLTLNWLLNLYDSTRTGYISMLSLKVGLALICCATREEKYIYMYELVANQRTISVDARRLGSLFEICMRVPIYLGEGDSFGGSEIIETSIRNCFSMSKFNPQNPNSIDLNDYLHWLKSEPQFIIWLPVLHRLLISEHISHQVRCKLCGANPIIGLRYRCLKCFKYNICQNCFLTGRHIHEHYDPLKHPMQEYCTITSSGKDVKDLTRILKNKLKPQILTRRKNN